MRTTAIIEGLTILEKYQLETDGYTIEVRKEFIVAFATDYPVEPADLARLVGLMWYQGSCEAGPVSRDDDDWFNVGDYDPAEKWICFVPRSLPPSGG